MPALSFAGIASGGGASTVSGTIAGLANTTYRIEVFASAGADPSGFGEGRTFLKSVNVTTGAAVPPRSA